MDGLFTEMGNIPYTGEESVVIADLNNRLTFTEQQLQATTQQAGNAIIGLQNQNNQLQHQAQNLANQGQLKDAKIQELEAEKARLKLERNELPRAYTIVGLNQGICIEPSKVRKPVGRIKILSKFKYRIVKDDSYTDMLYITYNDSNEIERYTVIPEDKIASKNLVKYFDGFYYVCKNADIANGFLAWYIEYTQTTDIKFIPEHAGFVTSVNADGKESAEFICNDGTIPIELIPHISENITKKTLSTECPSIEKTLAFAGKYLNTVQKCMLFAFHICGLISSMLAELKTPITQILVIDSPNPDVTRQTCYYIKSYDRIKPVLTFETNKTTLRKEFHGAKDETVVIEDCGINRKDTHLEQLLQNILTFDRDSETQPHNTAIISPFAKYLIPESQKICMTLDDDFYIPMTIEEEIEMCHALDRITRTIIDTICTDYGSFKSEIKGLIQSAKELEFFKSLNTNAANSYAVLYAVIQKCKKIFSTEIADEDFEKILIQAHEEAEIKNGSCEDAIVNDFMDVLNEAVHSGKLGILINSKHTDFIPENPQILIKDDIVLMEREVIENEIISHMKTAETVHQIQTSMKCLNLLHSTKDNCYPSTVYVGGKQKRVSFIAFKIDVLDDCSQLLVKENGTKDWFSTVSTEHTIPVCINSFGHYAMQDFDYNNDGNLHCFVTGISGSGKTLYLIERMVSLQKLHNHVVVFDTSSSFTKNEIIKKLSVEGNENTQAEVQKYIDENISFYDAEKEIPVDILKFGSVGSDVKLTRDISAIMMSHIPNMGKKQIATLNSAIAKLVEEKHITIPALCKKLLEGTLSDSLSIEITDMLYSFIEAKLSENSWSELFDKSKGIVIISSDAATGLDGSALVDMLLMSLYLNQRNNPKENFVIFVDEIQNQNVRQNSSITKILREGRKLHISLNYATQYLTGKSEAAKAMKNAGICVYFHSDDTSAKSVSKELMIPVADLLNMEQGECYIKGGLVNFELETTRNGKVHGRTYRNFIR
ncbi:MAG: hypothetical protein K2K02_04490 [Ruminococcus sp.]|nr:hypothetical protein [Ruminococcus sp.]